MPQIKNEVLWILGIVLLLAFYGIIRFTQWRMVRRVKQKYDKKEYELAEVRGRTSGLKYTWAGVFGFLFFVGVVLMGASLPIRALMLGLGMLVGSIVNGVVEGLRERRKMTRHNK